MSADNSPIWIGLCDDPEWKENQRSENNHRYRDQPIARRRWRGTLGPALPEQVDCKQRDDPAIAILRVERPLRRERFDYFKPQQYEKNRGAYQCPETKDRR